MIEVKEQVSNIVLSKIGAFWWSKENILTKSIEILLWENVYKYYFSNITQSLKKGEYTNDFMKNLSILSEKTKTRKDKWSYYTQLDTATYINNYLISIKYAWKYNKNKTLVDILNQSNIEKLLYNDSFFDPTCWSWEFLISIFNIKYNLLISKWEEITDLNIKKILKTIYWNDNDEQAIDICKIRLFFHVIEKIEKPESYIEIAKIINENFFCYDIISDYLYVDKLFDFIIGNPPYIEYSNYDGFLLKKYWNIYADVLDNVLTLLSSDWYLWFIIPISFISTPRMSKIRHKISQNTSLQHILSFADRPDCLFSWVHQKLNIIFLRKDIEGKKKELLTSNYNFWYKNERKNLYDKIETFENNFWNLWEFIPKIGNKTESDIFKKIIYWRKSIFESQEKQWDALYLNSRATFWIKAFSFNPWSNEYKQYKFNSEIYYLILCVLNSSLFRRFRICVSDCRHITLKELKAFKLPNYTQADIQLLKTLWMKLEDKLEKTKKHIATKQTEYEYKHVLCKDLIDEIDDVIWLLYWLSESEIKYIKKFALSYR